MAFSQIAVCRSGLLIQLSRFFKKNEGFLNRLLFEIDPTQLEVDFIDGVIDTMGLMEKGQGLLCGGRTLGEITFNWLRYGVKMEASLSMSGVLRNGSRKEWGENE